MTVATFTRRGLPEHLSHSQKSGFAYCPEQFRLSRVFKVPKRPAWNLAGGSAVHHVTEMLDRAMLGLDVQVPTFAEALQEQIDETLARNEGTTEADFRASGRKSTEWPNKEDKAWWLHNGPIMVRRWQDFTRNIPWDIAEFPDGPAIELEFNLPAVGTVINLKIDRVFRRRQTDDLIVVDLKSGAEPSQIDQLGLYKLAVEEAYGEEVRLGTYWMARDGSATAPVDLSEYTRERIEWEYGAFQFARDNGVYLPNPGKQCGYCEVRDFCYVQRGERSREVPRPWESYAIADSSIAIPEGSLS